MPSKPYLKRIREIDLTADTFDELAYKIGDQVTNIIINSTEEEEEIIDALPSNVRLVYLIWEFHANINGDGLLSIFINFDKSGVERFQQAIQQISDEQMLLLFNRAYELVTTKYEIQYGSLPDDEVDIDELFGPVVMDELEEIEQQIDKLPFWDKLEAIYKDSL